MVRTAASQFDGHKAYRDMLSGLDAATTCSRILAEVQSTPGTDGALAEFSEQLRDADIAAGPPMSDSARQAVAL